MGAMHYQSISDTYFSTSSRVICLLLRASDCKAVQQIVDAVWAKLPPAVFVLPVARAEGEPLQLRVTAADLEDDNLLDVVSAGCCEPSAEPLSSSSSSLLLRLSTEVWWFRECARSKDSVRATIFQKKTHPVSQSQCLLECTQPRLQSDAWK